MIPRDLLFRCARSYPDKIAYFCGDQGRTWRDMDRRSTLLASALQRLGTGKGDVVAILGRESFRIYEHFFACIKIGAVRVGINWRYPPNQILHVLRDCAPQVVIVEAGFEELLRDIEGAVQELGIRIIGYGGDHEWSLDYERLLRESEGVAPHLPDISADDVLFYSYTSGTTGNPKGVMLTHGGVVQAIVQSLIARGLTVDDVWYMAGQSCWMAVIMSMFGLVNGMSHVIPEGQFEIARFLRDVERFGVTAASLFPIMMQRAIAEVRSGHYELSTLRMLTYGSAPAEIKLLREAQNFFECDFVQAYGSTEAGGWVTHLSPADHRRGFSDCPDLLRSAGRPGLLYEVSVRDEEGNPVPPDTKGEIWIKGSTIMKGYLNQPRQTAEVLRGSWLRSNDIGRFDENGYLYLVDRRNFMIISGAVNVYPAGVEAVLLEHPGVDEAAVLGVPHPEWGEAVVAVVGRGRNESAVTAEELMAFCHRRLSKPESPKHVLFVENLPRTFTGKIDKNGLKRWLYEQAATLPWEVPRLDRRVK